MGKNTFEIITGAEKRMFYQPRFGGAEACLREIVSIVEEMSLRYLSLSEKDIYKALANEAKYVGRRFPELVL